MVTTDKLYALHEVQLSHDDRKLLIELRDLMKRFLVVETEILELTKMAMVAAAEAAALEEMGEELDA